MDDLISRQAAKNKKVYSEERHEYVVPVAEIDWLPSAQPTQNNTSNALKSLDCIDRQAAIEHLKKRLYETALNNVTEHPYYEEMADNRVSVWLKEVPSAQPEHTETHSCDYQRTETHESCTDCPLYDHDRHNCPRFNKVIPTAILDAQPRWIPVTEALPESDERVLVYTVTNEYHVWDAMPHRGEGYEWEDEEGLYHDLYEVEMWLPLPEPYAERRQE